MRMRFFVILFMLFVFCGMSIAQPLNDIYLAKMYPRNALEKIIMPRADWQPFPTWSNPAGLEQVPAVFSENYIREAEELLDAEWPPLPATVFLQFVRDGNRSNYEKLSFARRENLTTLVLGELFERKGRFMDQIVNGIWAVCEESFWGVPAHNSGRGLPDVAQPIVDLFAAETGAMMAWIHYLLAPQLDEINPLITQRMVLETKTRILTPYLEHNDWWWMGFDWRAQTGYARPVNNWNPWINSNVIACALLLENDPARRLDILHKTMDSIDNFVAPYPADGGCDEGPSYWGRAGASLFDCLELLNRASNGAINVYDQPLIKNIGTFITKAYIKSPYFINFADASAKINIDAPLVFRYGQAIGDQNMMSFAAFAAEQQGLGTKAPRGNYGAFGRVLPALFCMNELLSTNPAEPFYRDVWLPNLQVMAARSQEGSADGFYLAAKGGHNDESHNHNDVGNFIVYHDGLPVLIDAGAQTYTAKTFSSQRYELWNNQSAFHNLPTINGVMQKEGREFAARNVRHNTTKSKAEFALDIAGAYPENANVESWQRRLVLDRGKNVEINENFKLKQAIAPVEFNFMTPLQPATEKRGQIVLTSADSQNSFSIVFDKSLQPTIEPIAITDNRMTGSWGSQIYRIVFKAAKPATNGSYVFRVEK